MISFLSCDWGTSSFRLSLVDATDFNVLASTGTDEGILATYNSWLTRNSEDVAERMQHYLAVIKSEVKTLEARLQCPLQGTPLLISGMASSTIGIQPLPYHVMPFSIEGDEILTSFIPRTHGFAHDILLVSGVQTSDDVMRGEETQLVGLLAQRPAPAGRGLYILPGTHSKHIMVDSGEAVDFKTFMTGEFFDLLSKKSILHAGVEMNNEELKGDSKDAFLSGVAAGSKTNLLHAAFTVRTNSLFGKLNKKNNYHYLSGLLIGAELQEITHNDTFEIYLCCGRKLRPFYEAALEFLGLQQRLFSFDVASVEKAAMIGQFKIFEKQIKR